MHNPPFDDIKDALASCMGIIKVPMNHNRFKTEPQVTTHTRFGGVA
jgi:hypothetical protein